MKIGDEVYIHGYVDEIRKDVVIIRNAGGYFGTIEDEIVQDREPKTEHWIDNKNIITCSYCRVWFHKDDRYFYMHYCPFCGAKMKDECE